VKEATPEQTRLARKKRRQEGRREFILGAARAVLRGEGLEAFTLAAVAEEADLSKTALFYYFESKDDLLAALTAERLQAESRVLLDAVESAPSGIDALAELARAHVGFHRDDLESFRALERWVLASGVRDRLLKDAVYPGAARVNDALETRLAEDERGGRLRRGAEPRRLANVAYTSAHGLLTLAASIESLGGRLRFDLDELLDETCATLVHGARR
jgi:AcrR family transcriptional regulator